MTSVAFSQSNARLATTSSDGTVLLWPLRSSYRAPGARAATPIVEALATIDTHAVEFLSCDFSPDGDWLATACADGKARLVDAETGALAGVMDHGAGAVHCVAFSADGVFLACAAKKVVRVWRANGRDGANRQVKVRDLEGPAPASKYTRALLSFAARRSFRRRPRGGGALLRVRGGREEARLREPRPDRAALGRGDGGPLADVRGPRRRGLRRGAER